MLLAPIIGHQDLLKCPYTVYLLHAFIPHHLQISHPFDNLMRSLSGPPFDHLAPKVGGSQSISEPWQGHW
jgi:hypothetical protein